MVTGYWGNSIERTSAAPDRPDPGGLPRWAPPRGGPAVDCSKLVSHRLRGFGPEENCRSALRRACASTAPCLEIDTRVAADGRIFVYHNPRGRRDLTGRPHIAQVNGARVGAARYLSGETVLELDEALQIFQGRRHHRQQLCLDMKDVGFEAEHVALVDRYGLLGRTCWMSWVPSSVERLHQLGVTGPLVLAHWNLTRLSTVGHWLHAALSQVDLRMRDLVIRGVDCAPAVPDNAHGFQHSLVCTRLPAGLERLLARSGGGVCVHRSLVNDRLARYCRDAGLQLWIFRVATAAGYALYAANEGVTRVCCDDAPAVLQEAGVG
jgi:glycerophosphoryl diester phosphodiesterase